jgi:hypothetical protein
MVTPLLRISKIETPDIEFKLSQPVTYNLGSLPPLEERSNYGKRQLNILIQVEKF